MIWDWWGSLGSLRMGWWLRMGGCCCWVWWGMLVWRVWRRCVYLFWMCGLCEEWRWEILLYVVMKIMSMDMDYWCFGLGCVWWKEWFMIMNECLWGLVLRCRREFWKLLGFWFRVIFYRKLMIFIFWFFLLMFGVILIKYVLFLLFYLKDVVCLWGMKYLLIVVYVVMLCEEFVCENICVLYFLCWGRLWSWVWVLG